ncbi:MAG: HAMP domain-containing sensor histidine kinase [Bacteroidales bacterium]
MLRLRTRLSLFNMLTKLLVASVFLLVLPYIVKRINLIQTDNDLVEKREQVISMISQIGIEPFIASDSSSAFGSYNILREEFISIERTASNNEINEIEETKRLIDNEEIAYRILNYSLQIDGRNYILSVGKSLASIGHTERNIRIVILVFMVVIIVITFITDLQYTRRLLKPLDKITGKLREIQDPSVFDRQPVETTTSDFVSLDQAFIELMDKIDKLFRKEKETTVNISHELLTPVSVVRSKLENLLLMENLHPDVTDKIGESLKTLYRLQSLINSLLMIARLESRQYLKEDSLFLKELINEVVEENIPLADDKGIVISQDLSSDYHFSGCNRSLLFSMFYNVLNNAVKNTPADGRIIIRSNQGKGLYNVEIHDNGNGLPPEVMKNLFSRFVTGKDEAGNGTGIGLAIAKSIADFHGITITVSSEKEKGTTFSFSFTDIS